MKPGAYNIPDHIKGDEFIMANPIQYIKNGVPIDLTGALIEMWVRSRSAKGQVHLKWSTVSGEITITDAVNGKFRVNPIIVDLPSGRYYYDIQLTLGGGVYTYLAGYWNIIEDSTK